MAINHYQLFGIPEDADEKRIKSAYRSLAKRFHPDLNQGSDAASELFRKINEAYRILSDDALRLAYDRQLAQQRERAGAPPQQPKKPAASSDPQQKFNRFVNSLLGAIFAEPEASPAPLSRQHSSPPKQPPRKVRSKPDFNFYYYLAKEQGTSPYACDEDGIYRRHKQAGRQAGERNKYRRVPGSSLAILLLTGLWEYFK